MTISQTSQILPVDEIVVGDAVDTLGSFPSESVHLSVFSPPYDDIRDYNKKWNLDYQALGSELNRVTVDGGICAVVIGDGTKNFAKSLTSFRWAISWCDDCDWKLFECCIYKRHGNPGAWWTKRFRVDHEYILIFFKGKKPRYFDKDPLKVDSLHAGKKFSGTDRLTNGGFKRIEPKPVNKKKCRGTIWNYATSNTEGNRTKLKHPATFPDQLAADLIECFSGPGDVVLDPMSGSGTTCVMANRLDRRFVGIEINPEYQQIAQHRLNCETQYLTSGNL